MTGPLRDLWEWLGAWDDHVPEQFQGDPPDETPLHFAAAVGLLDSEGPPTLLAHVNFADADALDRLARSSASVVYCPRTHAFFGHPPHPFEQMLERGVNVCLGTDSRASSPDLNLLAEVRHVASTRPHLSPGQLWSMVTHRPAAALGLEDEVGQLATGLEASMAAFSIQSSRDPLEAAIYAEPPAAVIVRGELRSDAPPAAPRQP